MENPFISSDAGESGASDSSTIRLAFRGSDGGALTPSKLSIYYVVDTYYAIIITINLQWPLLSMQKECVYMTRMYGIGAIQIE